MTAAVPAGHAVDLWWADVSGLATGPAEAASLDAAERARAAAFMLPADGHRYQAAHVVLRQVLACYLRARPAELMFARQPCPRCGGASGRPVLAAARGTGAAAGRGGRRPFFSLAHSGTMVVIAVAGSPVGVDVEQDPARCVCSLTAVLHPADGAALAALPEPARHRAVITCWVRVEAVLKCTGEGIVHGLGGFPVWQPGGPASPAGGCAVADVAAPGGYQAAVALAGAGPIVPRAREWP